MDLFSPVYQSPRGEHGWTCLVGARFLLLLFLAAIDIKPNWIMPFGSISIFWSSFLMVGMQKLLFYSFCTVTMYHVHANVLFFSSLKHFLTEPVSMSLNRMRKDNTTWDIVHYSSWTWSLNSVLAKFFHWIKRALCGGWDCLRVVPNLWLCYALNIMDFGTKYFIFWLATEKKKRS